MPTMRCSERARPRRVRPAAGGAWLVMLLWLPLTGLAKPGTLGPELEPVPADDLVLARVDNSNLDPQLAANQQRLRQNPQDVAAAAQVVRRLIQLSRQRSDPRYLGYAQALLSHWRDAELPPVLRLLRATLRQSLHQFDAALTDLTQLKQQLVVAGDAAVDGPQLLNQVLLTEAVVRLVQGDYAGAAAACNQLEGRVPLLLSQSCQSQVLARTGNAHKGYEQLLQCYQHADDLDAESRHWALVTLAELAQQLGDARAPLWWRQAFALAPDDLYSRAGLADVALSKGDTATALALTRGYEFADNLLLLRALAMQQQGDPAAAQLRAQLQQRFDEARWRGEMLHGREYARFLLQLRHDPQAALQAAQANWQVQREPEDVLILLQTARAAGRPDVLAQVQGWLRQQGQVDVRYASSGGVSL